MYLLVVLHQDGFIMFIKNLCDIYIHYKGSCTWIKILKEIVILMKMALQLICASDTEDAGNLNLFMQKTDF